MNLIAEDTSPSREEVYEALVRSLRRRKGFGIVFVQCSPAEATRLIKEIQADLPQKQFANLNFDAPIDNLYDVVDELPNRENLNILFIQGLEKSLEPYIKPGYGGDGDYYNVDTVPTILSHLNQRREVFRDNFHNICFVFFLPLFATNYIIRRSPDFYDWSAGIFEFLSEMDSLEIQRDIIHQDLATLEDRDVWFKKGNELYRLGRYEEAIAAYDKALEIKPDYHWAWNNRGIALGILGRYEEEIASYDKALEIKSDFHLARLGRGNALRKLGRYEEALASYNKAIEIKPDYHLAWNIRGITLGSLGRYEEAITSYDKALEIKLDYHLAWNNRGNALRKLGRYEEAIASYNKAIEIKPDYHLAWNNRGIALRKLGRYEEAISTYQQCLIVVREMGDRQREILILSNLIVTYGSLRKYRQIVNYLQQYLNIIEDMDELEKETLLRDSMTNLRNLFLINIQKLVNLFKKFWKLIGRVIFSLEE